MLTITSHVDAAELARPVTFGRILCAVDFSLPSLNALAHALSIAEEADATITLLHVIDVPPELAASNVPPDADIATLAAVITDPAFLADSSVNKVAAGFADPARPARALYFSKAPVPWGDGPHYEHVGLYAYRRAALDGFVALPRGVLEQRERLEQLRALEAGMRIWISLIDQTQLGVQVDTPADLARARRLMREMR